MIRVEYEFLCDECDRQEIVCGDVRDAIKRLLPWLWTHSRDRDLCGWCNGRAAKEQDGGGLDYAEKDGE